MVKYTYLKLKQTNKQNICSLEDVIKKKVSHRLGENIHKLMKITQACITW